MAQPVFYQTLTNLGVDPTLYYTNIATAGGSVLPEYPAPPFTPGTRAFGSDGSEFLFVQAQSTISLGDFVVIQVGSSLGPAASPYQANSITTTNVVGSFACEIGATGLILKQSVTTIPTSAMFWACVKGQFIPAYGSYSAAGGLTTAAGTSILYTTATAGAMTTVQNTVGGAFAGFTVVSSLSTSIAASVIPPVGTLTSSGFTQGPVVSLNKPRTVYIYSSASGLSSLALGW